MVSSAMITAAGCSRKPTYSKETPEAVIESAKAMVVNGDARQLTTLIYADAPEMRTMLDNFGVLLGNLQKLAATIQKTYPKEIAKLKKQAEEEGQVSGLLAGMFKRSRSGGFSISPETMENRDGFEHFLRALLADPYSWLESSADSLSVRWVSEDVYAIWFDDKPVLPPFGLVMARDSEGDGDWGVVLPLKLPGVSRIVPRDEASFEVFNAVIAVFNNTLVDLRKDIESGKVPDLDGVSERAGERTFMPMMMAFYAYSKVMDEANEREKQAKKKAREERKKRREALKKENSKAEGGVQDQSEGG